MRYIYHKLINMAMLKCKHVVALSCLVMLLCCGNIFGQTTVNYNFEGADRTAWTFVNGSVTNKWCISKNANAQNGGTYSLYVTNGTGGLQTGTAPAYAYTISSASVVWAYMDITFPASASDYTLSFDWKCYGESTYDYFSAYLGPTTSTVTAGTTLTAPTDAVAFVNNLRTSNTTYFNDYNGSAYITSTAANVPWRTFTITLDAATYAGQTKRLFFAWKNDTSTGVGYPAAIDNIKLIYTQPTCDETITLSGNMTKTIDCNRTYCFYDSGGASGNYGNNQDYTATFTSNGAITLTFESFATQSTNDYLTIYDGNAATGTVLLQNASGTTVPTGVTAVSGTMTVVWHSNNSQNNTGWKAYITGCGYVDPCPAIGNGPTASSSGTYRGIYTYWNYYAYTQQLYLASELTAAGVRAGVLESIALNYVETTASSLPFEVYLGQTNQTTVPTSWITDAGLTLVYTGTINFTQGWNTINISNANWTWDGTSNIVVAFRRTSNTQGAVSYPNFYYIASTGMTVYTSNSSSSISLNGSNVPSSAGSTTNQRPYMKFCVSGCTQPTGTFSLSQNSGLIMVGSTLNISGYLTNNLSPAGTISYSSSAPTIASVNNNGVITGVSRGTAIINVTYTPNNSNYCSRTLTFSVNVSDGCPEIGEGTACSYTYGPVNNYFKYGYYQYIYPLSNYSNGGDITSIAFQYCYTTAMTKKTNVNIYMGLTSNSTFATESSWIPLSQLTLVYSGPLNCSVQGWNTINLQTPFYYDGSSNLVVAIDDNSNQYDGSSYTFNYTAGASGEYVTLYEYDDSSNPDPAAPPSGTRSNGRPNTKFCIENCTPRTLTFAQSTYNLTSCANISQVPTVSVQGGTITYTSSTPSVATVSSAGVVTPISSGTTTITATVSAHNGYCQASGSYTVNVDVSGSSHTLTYNCTTNCSGSVSNVPPSVSGVSATVTSMQPTCSGKYFVGWNTAADGSGASYAAGSTVDMACANVTLYAQYSNTPPSITGSPDCENAMAFCASNETDSYNLIVEHQDNTTTPAGFCQYYSQNATWWYLRISRSGPIEMTISSTAGDVDFACWGPFDNTTCDAQNDLTDNSANRYYYFSNNTYHVTNTTTTPDSSTYTSSGYLCAVTTLAQPCGNLVDYGTSSYSVEYLQIANAIEGQIYIVAIGNWANQDGVITFNQTNIGQANAGLSDCSIVNDCSITSISTIVGTCNGDNTFSVSGNINFTDAPLDGTLTVTDGTVTSTYYPPFSSPMSYTLDGIAGDGQEHTITAAFNSSSVNCSRITYIDAPLCETNCPDATVALTGYSEVVGDIYYYNVCLNSGVNMAATQTGYTNPSWTWSVNPHHGVAPTILSGRSVSYTPSAEQGYDVSLTVAEGQCSTVAHARIRVSSGPQTDATSVDAGTICVGNSATVTIGGSGSIIEVTDTTYDIESTLGQAGETFIPDGPNCTEQCYTSSVTFYDYEEGAVVQNVDAIEYLRINMEHSFIGDVQIKLTCPSGRSAIILQDIYSNDTSNHSMYSSQAIDPYTYIWPDREMTTRWRIGSSTTNWYTGLHMLGRVLYEDQNDSYTSNGYTYYLASFATAADANDFINNFLLRYYVGNTYVIYSITDANDNVLYYAIGYQSGTNLYFVWITRDNTTSTNAYSFPSQSAAQYFNNNVFSGSGVLSSYEELGAYNRIYFGEPDIYDVTDGTNLSTTQICDGNDVHNISGVGYDYAWTSSSDYTTVGYVYDVANMSTSTTVYDNGTSGTNTLHHVIPSDVNAGTHIYQPYQSFSNLIGCPLNGTWTVSICDSWAKDNGYIFNWELALDPALLPNDWSYTVGLESVTVDCGSMVSVRGNDVVITPTAGSNMPNNCNITLLDRYGCTTVVPMTFDVVEPTLVLTSGANVQEVCEGQDIENIVYTLGGSATNAIATGLPDGVSLSVSGTTATISGIPTTAGRYTYTIYTRSGDALHCDEVSLGGTIVVNVGNIVPVFDQVGPYCEGTTVSALPTTSNNGITGTWSPQITNETNRYTFTPAPGQCATTTTMDVTVNPLPTLEYTSGSETLCANVASAENIVYTFGGGANGADVTGLPADMEFNIVGSTIVISGTPRQPGTYQYTVTTTGAVDPCVNESIDRTITVNESPTLVLTSGSNNQTVCENSAITPLVYTYGGGATGAQATYPAGLTTSLNTTAHTLTISGTPSESGTITVVTTGVNAPCEDMTLTASVTVNELPELTLLSASADVSLCRDVTWTGRIQYSFGGSATGATVSGLPDGVEASVSGSTVTISGNPIDEPGVYDYIVTTVGATSPCTNIELSGSITVSTNATLDLTSPAGTDNQSLCLPDDFQDIVYTFGGGATGVDQAALNALLPAGVTATVNTAAQTVTISGAPTVTGTFNYSVTTTGSIDPCKSETQTGTIVINRKPELIVAGNDNQSFCLGNPMTNLVFTYSGGATGALVSGVLSADLTTTNGTNTLTISGTPANAGQYTFSVTTDGAAGACNDVTLPVSITVYDNPTPSITTSETQICNGSSVTLTSNPATYESYAWTCTTSSNANYTINQGMPATTSGSSIVVRPEVTPGNTDVTYSLTVTDANSCTASVSTAITVSDIPEAVVSTSPNTKCETPYNGSITVGSFTGASAGGNYIVTLNGLTRTTTGANVVFGDLEPGTYTVRVASESNLDACYTDYTVTIADEPTQPTVTISGQFSICDNTSTTLTAHADNGLGTFTYLWSDNSTTETIETENLVASRLYYVVATDENGCTAYDEATVTIGDTPDVSISQVSPICIGKNAVLQALVSNAGTGYTLEWSATPSANSGLNTTSGDRITVTPTTAGSYQYTVRLTTRSCNSGADYIVNSDPITVVVNPLPDPGITNNTGTNILTCNVTSISLTATGGTSYAWDNGSNVADNIVNAVGTYTVTVTDANTCSATTDITITNNIAVPQVAITEPASRVLTCSNNETITLEATSTTPNATLEWTTMTVTTPNTYTVQATGENGCTNSASIEITRNVTLPTVGINNPPTRTITCANPTIELTAYGSGTLSWETQTVDRDGTYEVIATAANGCTASASINIDMDKTPPTMDVVSSGDILSCRVLSVTLTASGARTYVWSDANSSTSATVSVTAPDTYRVTGTASNGCTAAASYTINPDYSVPDVSIEAVTNTLTCDVRSINLAAQSTTLGTTFSWTTNRVSQPGQYSVVATGPNGCTASASIDIFQNVDLPEVGIFAPDTVLTCNNHNTITLSASGTGTLSWTTLDVTAPGIYELVATADNGCQDTARITIHQNIATPNVRLLNNTGTDVLTCDIRSISVSVEDDSDADIYVWSAGGENTTGTGNAFTSPGTYSVTATAPNGCTSTASINIGQNIENPTVSITNNTGTNTLTCDVTQILVTAVGSASTVTVDNYQWSQGTTQVTANNSLVTIGTYVVTATASNGCTATAQIVIDESVNRPNIDFQNITGTTVLTCDITSIEVTATGTGASYQWSGGSSPSVANNRFDAIGTYYVTATGSNGCTNSRPFSITENIVPPRVSITNESGYNEINCNFTLVNVTATGSGDSYLWSNGVDVAANTFTSPGTYTVTSTASNGCTSTASVVITEDHNPPIPTIRSTNGLYILDCAHPSLILNAAGGASYLWTPGGQTTSQITVTTPDTYIVEATGTNGCVATASVEIGINVEPPAVAIDNITGEEQINCNVTNIHIIAQGGYLYAWSNALWGGGAEQTITEAGVYTVTVTSVNGCTASESLTIIADTISPTLQANSVTGFYELNCDVDQIVVEATGNGVSYAWSGGTNPTNSTNVFTNAGLYYVTSTGYNGCTSSVAVQPITTNYTAPTVSIVDPLNTVVNIATLNCITPDTTLTVQGTGISYLWNDSEIMASRTFTQTQHGIYTVTATGSNGCTSATSVEIRTDFNTPAAQIINNTGALELNCVTNSIALTANGGTGASYAWSNGTNNRNIVITTPDTYTVTVTGANGCTNTNSVRITQAPVFEASITNVGTINCNGGSTSATVTATGGNPGYYYTWSDGQNFATANNLVAGSYTVTVRDNGGCSAVLTCNITQPQPLNVGLISHDLYCGVSRGSIDASVTGGTQSYNYMWSNGTSGTSVNNLQVGNYSLTVTDAHMCVATASASIRMLGTLAVSTSVVQPISCNGSNDGVVAVNCENGAVPFVYSWSTGQGISELHNMFEGSYQVTVTDAWGCSGQSSVTLVAPAAMFVDLTPVAPKCYNTSDGHVNVMATGGVSPYTYAWNNSTSSPSLTNVAAGTYSLTITDAAGCTTSRNVTIEAPEAVSMEVATTDVKCYGDKNGKIEVAAYGGTEPYRYSVERVLELSTSSMFTNIAAGYYNIRVTDANGCEAGRSAVVKQPEEMKVEAVSEDPFCKNSRTGMINVSVIGGVLPYQYYWDNYMSDSSLMLNIPEGQYSVGVVDANGCRSQDVKVTLVDVDVDCLRIPNVFTPNGDGINDEWIIANLNMFPEAQIYVFNRWGQLMYKTTGDGEPWDGSYRGHYVPAGTYIYVIDLFNDDEPYKGTVTIVY